MGGMEDLLKIVADEREAYATRIDAIESIRGNREERVLQALIMALSSSDLHVRRKAAEVLGDYRDEPKAFDALRRAFEDKDEGVRRNVLRSLGGFPAEQIADLVQQAQRDPSPLVQRAAQDILKSFPEEFKRPSLRAMEEPAKKTAPPAPRTPKPKLEEALAAFTQEQPETPHVAQAPTHAPAQPGAAEPHQLEAPTSREPLGLFPTPDNPVSAGPSAVLPGVDILVFAWRAAWSLRLVELCAIGLLVIFVAATLMFDVMRDCRLACAIDSWMFRDVGRRGPVANLCALSLCALFSWLALSFVGLAVCRSVACGISTGQGVGRKALLAFALRRWRRAFFLPFFWVIGLIFLGALLGFLLRVDASEFVSSPVARIVFFPLRLILAALVVGMCAILTLGGPLWLPCIAVEDGGIRYAVSTSILYLVRKPWTCLVYYFVTVMRTGVIVGLILIALMLADPGRSWDMMPLFTLERLRLAWSRPDFTQWVGNLCAGGLQAAILLLTAAWALASLLAGATGAYLALRASVSGVLPTQLVPDSQRRPVVG